MNVSNELQVDRAAEETVVRALRATQANDAEIGPSRHSEQTDQCPTLARFLAVRKFGSGWTKEEQAHIASGCMFCQKMIQWFGAAESDTEEIPNDHQAAEDTVYETNTSEETRIELPGQTGASDDTKLG